MPDSVSILVVDDSADKRVALEAILRDLDVDIVEAASGAEALRRLLQGDFAVVLLDVRMPGMDGFETAALIRQRPRTAQVPIIFITALGEETHVARGYSLRAVDYLLTPVVPDVLRTKVGVFVELYRATAAVRQQAARLRRRAEQLHRLAHCSMTIQAARTLDAIVQCLADGARDVLGAEDALVVARVDERRAYRAVAQRPFTGALPALGANGHGRDGGLRGPGGRLDGDAHRTLLTAPLAAGEGRRLGLVHVAGAPEAEFGQEDRDLLAQLAHMGSIAIDNALSGEAREANRLKDEFLATVSHELRTPLSALLSWTWMLRRGGLDPAATQRALEAVERNARAQARLVDDLLDVSRIVTGKLQLASRRLDLAALVAAAADSAAAAAAAKGVVLERAIDPGAGNVIGDPDRLQQVVGNLLSNAVKFTPGGGRIQLLLARVGPHAELTVRDTGQGIASAFLPHVFERFRQADAASARQKTGLGLGLAIVRHLVELHGGTVEAHSDGEGRGACFVVRLPVAGADDRAPSEAAAGLDRELATAPGLHGVRVLVVEDDVDTRDALVTILEQAGALVTAVGCADDAVAAVCAVRPEVLVCDIGLPGEDGYHLLGRVRGLDAAEVRDVPAIAVTAFARPVDRARALGAGFQAHVSKPFLPGELTELVAQVASGRPAPPAIEASESMA